MNRLITFPVNKDESIEIQRFSEDEEIHRYEEISIVYKCGNIKYILYSNDFIIEALSALKTLLNKAINGELALHDSLIEKGIGFWSNENFQNNSGLVMIEGKEGQYWVGDKYLLWDSVEYQTWIYNLKNEVAIEVTPTYRWHFDEPDEEANDYMPYEKFRANYKTCFVRTFSLHIAKSWLNQCQDILNKLT